MKTQYFVGAELPNKLQGNCLELNSSGFMLYLKMSGILPVELNAIKQGVMLGGFKYKQGAVLAIIYFRDKKGIVNSFDLPFDIRKVSEENRAGVMNVTPDGKTDRYSVLMTLVDESNTIQALRYITMHPDCTKKLHHMLQEQLSSKEDSDVQIDKWYKHSTAELAKTTMMYVWGN